MRMAVERDFTDFVRCRAGLVEKLATTAHGRTLVGKLNKVPKKRVRSLLKAKARDAVQGDGARARRVAKETAAAAPAVARLGGDCRAGLQAGGRYATQPFGAGDAEDIALRPRTTSSASFCRARSTGAWTRSTPSSTSTSSQKGAPDWATTKRRLPPCASSLAPAATLPQRAPRLNEMLRRRFGTFSRHMGTSPARRCESEASLRQREARLARLAGGAQCLSAIGCELPNTSARSVPSPRASSLPCEDRRAWRHRSSAAQLRSRCSSKAWPMSSPRTRRATGIVLRSNYVRFFEAAARLNYESVV